MCLAVPYVIKKISENGSALGVSNGVELEIRLDLIENPALGDTVLVHAGFAIQKLGEKESAELMSLWEEVRKAEQAATSIHA